MLGKLDITCKRMKLAYYLTPYTKIHSKWMNDFNISPETIKLLEQYISGKLLDIGLGDEFLNQMSKGKATKAKIIRITSY